MTAKERKASASIVVERLNAAYPVAECALMHENAWQLLAATILSAQCTDVRVNMVTPELFRQFPNAVEMALATQEQVEFLVKTTGFFRQKTMSLISMSQDIVVKYDGIVPDNLDELVTLRGVGRKTANVVLGVIFGGDAVVVDTHVKRLSKLLGWTKSDDPVKIEQELMKLVAKPDWTQLAHRLILHGRAICIANRPKCVDCILNDLCPTGRAKLTGKTK